VTKVVVIFGFLMAFVAGLIVGVNRPQQVVSNSGAPGGGTSTRPVRGPGELDALLALRSDQKDAMRKIWSETADRGRKEIEKRRDDLRRERDEKTEALLSSDQKTSIKQIREQYDQQREALDREMRANFHKAVEATKAILDDAQRAKYEQWLEKREWGRGPRGGGDRGPDGGDRGSRGGGGGPPHHDRETTRKSDAGATSRPSDPS
jgi:hypothetical protein